MRFRQIISAIDSHAEGEPARVVTGGIPFIPGNTMHEKWLWAKDNLDELRKLLLFEPRGSNFMVGSIITPPSSPEAGVGVIFLEVSGFIPMCGHATIATCTVLVEMGIVPAVEPYTAINLDTPAGLVKARVHVENGIAKDVTFQNVPAFVCVKDLEVEVPGIGRIVTDIAWGGNFYACVSTEGLGIEIKPEYVHQIIDLGTKIRDAIFDTHVEVVHPQDAIIHDCTHVRLISPPDHPQADTKNAVFYAVEGIDRSPCGTGTSAEMAVLYSKGRLKLNEEFVSESIIGSLYYGNVVAETQVGPYAAIVPTIRGSAYVTGIQQFVLDERDPWPAGFYMGKHTRWG